MAALNTGSARNNSASRWYYKPQTVKIILNCTLVYIDKRIILYLCKCNLWLAAESGSSFLMNKNAFATVLSTLEPEKFL